MTENNANEPRAVDIQQKELETLQEIERTLQSEIGQANLYLNQISGGITLQNSILYSLRDAVTAPPDGQAEPEPIQETLWRIYAGALADHNTLIKIKNAIREPDSDDGEGNTIPGATTIDTLQDVLDAVNELDIHLNYDD